MDAYEKLANAIILQAVKDWRAARRKLKRKPQNESARGELGNCERFFYSEWFTTLTDVDGTVIFRKLYEEDAEVSFGTPTPIPENFRTEVLKEELDDKGVLIENAQVELESFALLFEFDGDQRHIRHVLYNCAAFRPGIEGKTNEDTREVQTETLIIKATPLSNVLVKSKTGNTTDARVYNDWYKSVYMPTIAEAEERGVA